jgi:hypothetical protein
MYVWVPVCESACWHLHMHMHLISSIFARENESPCVCMCVCVWCRKSSEPRVPYNHARFQVRIGGCVYYMIAMKHVCYANKCWSEKDQHIFEPLHPKLSIDLCQCPRQLLLQLRHLRRETAALTSASPSFKVSACTDYANSVPGSLLYM